MEKQRKSAKVKEPREIDCSSCHHKCTNYINEEVRKKICEAFWSLNYSRQKDFILANVKSSVPKRRRPTTKGIEPKRKNTKTFFLCDRRVCQLFFLSTLAISNGPLNNAFKNKSDFANFFVGDDKRGRHPPKNKLKNDLVQSVVKFLDRQCINDSNIKFRKKLIMISRYRSLKSLYKAFKEDHNECPSYTTFKKIFHENDFSFPHEKVLVKNTTTTEPVKTDKIEIQSMEIIDYVPVNEDEVEVGEIEALEEAEVEMLNLPSTSSQQIENSSDVIDSQVPDSTSSFLNDQQATEVYEIQFVAL